MEEKDGVIKTPSEVKKTLDKPENLWYSIITKGKEKEIKKMTTNELEKKIKALDKKTASKMLARMFAELIFNPDLFTADDRDDEQLAWFEQTLNEIQGR